MAVIYISKLNSELKRNILNRKYTLAEMEQIREQMSQLMNTRKKGFHRALILVIVCMAITMIPSVMKSGIGPAFWICLGVLAAAIVVAMVIVWLNGAGYMKYQYNRVIQKAYPEHADMLML